MIQNVGRRNSGRRIGARIVYTFKDLLIKTVSCFLMLMKWRRFFVLCFFNNWLSEWFKDSLMKVNQVSDIIIDSLTDTDSHILAKQCKTRVPKKCKWKESWLKAKSVSLSAIQMDLNQIFNIIIWLWISTKSHTKHLGHSHILQLQPVTLIAVDES